MPRAVLSIASVILALSGLPAAAAAAEQTAQATLDARYYQQRRATLESLAAQYESAVARFEANDEMLDRERGAIKQRQALLDLRKREYREALARCSDTACIDALNPQRDTINADQVLINRDIDGYNARMAERETEAAKLDLLEAQINEVRADVQRLEQDRGGIR